MAQDIDQFPIRDKIAKEDGYLTDLWVDVMGNLFQTLVGYLSANGIFVPKLTTEQRDDLNNVVEGQMIYNTTLRKFQGYEGSPAAWVNFV